MHKNSKALSIDEKRKSQKKPTKILLIKRFTQKGNHILPRASKISPAKCTSISLSMFQAMNYETQLTISLRNVLSRAFHNWSSVNS